MLMDKTALYYNMVKSKIVIYTEWCLNSQKGHWASGRGYWLEMLPEKTLKLKPGANSKRREGEPGRRTPLSFISWM